MKTVSLFSSFIALLFTGVQAMAQNTEVREVSSFSKISIRDNAKVIIDGFGTQRVQVESDAPLQNLRTKTEGSTLVISGPAAKLHITMEKLEGVEISGFGSVTSDSVVTGQNLRIDINGNGKINLPVNVDNLQAGISGFGKVSLSGEAKRAEINVNGNGKIQADNLKVGSCEANISGVAKCVMDVTNQLVLSISGTGSFYYKTTPPKLETHISGIGKYGAIGDDGEEGSTSSSSSSSGQDTVTVNVGNRKIVVIGDDEDMEDYKSFKNYADTIFRHSEKACSHWAGFEIGFNTLMFGNGFNSSAPAGYEYMDLNSGKSIDVNLNFYAHDFQLYKRYLMFTTGIGMTLNNYRFTSDQTLRADTNRVAAGFDYLEDGTKISYSKNKLAVNYFTVPLLLQFNSSESYKKSVHVAAGFLLNYKFNSHLKLVYRDGGTREKTKRQHEFNINPFRCDATLRVGYRDVSLYASYSLSDMFKSGRGPEVHPFQVGLCLVNW